MPSHTTTTTSLQPDLSKITGHEVLIFHSSPYPLAFNRIYTRLSRFKKASPPLRVALLSHKEGTLRTCPSSDRAVSTWKRRYGTWQQRQKGNFSWQVFGQKWREAEVSLHLFLFCAFVFCSIQKWVWNDWTIHAERSYLRYFSIFIHPNASLRNKSYLLLQKCSFDCRAQSSLHRKKHCLLASGMHV